MYVIYVNFKSAYMFLNCCYYSILNILYLLLLIAKCKAPSDVSEGRYKRNKYYYHYY